MPDDYSTSHVTREVAFALRAAGLSWTPRNGDLIHVPDRDLDEVTFVLSDMVVEHVTMPDGSRVLAFNGTTEWALDALLASEALWLPREDQVRVLLGDSFETLEQLPPPTGGYAVTCAGERHVDTTVANAYARALLQRLAQEPPRG